MNTPYPINLTDEGIEIDFNFPHIENAELPIFVKFDFSPNNIISKFVQWLNASFPIVSTNEGIEIDFNFPHLENAELPIFVNFDFFPNNIFFKFEHLQNT